jgi:uroporphyrinogen decarboxylase
VDCTPIWLMRQAGRYMEEYREIRKKHTFLEMCKTPELATEVTLQPTRRFDLDAAIIFSDILLPLEPMGISLRFSDAGGPVIETPVRTRQDILNLKAIDPEADLLVVLTAIEQTCSELSGRIPLIGFCGAPFTLASYLIEGGGSKNYQLTKTLMHSDAASFHLLMEKLTNMAVGYLNSQISHGAAAVQVFYSWIGTLSTDEDREDVLPHMKRLFLSIEATTPSIHFGVGTFHLLKLMREAGGAVLGTDWRVPIDEAWELVGTDRAIQGNLDPTSLFNSSDHIDGRVRDILGRIGARQGHIFNLGHGILPGTPIDNVELLVETVHHHSKQSGA